MALFPDWPQIDAFHQPLQPGEREVVGAYDRLQHDLVNEAISLDVYVQPYLENRRPDLVLAVAKQGIMIVEVKDWLSGRDTKRREFIAACRQAEQYRDILLELCLHDVYQLIEERGWADKEKLILSTLEASLTVAVAVPFIESPINIDRPPCPIITAGELHATSRLPRPARRDYSKLGEEFDEALAAFWSSLRSWLSPPFHRAEQGTFAPTGAHGFTKAQLPHAKPRGPGWYRIQGPAGSGKTLILAHKAAIFAYEGKRVLFACYNKTLRYYIRDLIARMPYSFHWEQIAIYHFHEFIKGIRLEFQYCFDEEVTENMSDEEFIENHYPKVVLELLDAHPGHPFKFDAVLIDEGQDFKDDWITILGRCLAEGGELVLVRDKFQNVYHRDSSHLDADGPSIQVGKGMVGFGPWANLKTTHRMSAKITRAISGFARRELGADEFDIDVVHQDQRDLISSLSLVKWQNVGKHDIGSAVIDAVNHIAKKVEQYPTHVSDIAVLTNSNAQAFELVQSLAGAGLEACHVYDQDGKRDARRIFRFRKGDGRIKVCTGHSFKGFEVWAAIVCISPTRNTDSQAEWSYTSMGRALECLWVVNSNVLFNDVANWFNKSRPSSATVDDDIPF